MCEQSSFDIIKKVFVSVLDTINNKNMDFEFIERYIYDFGKLERGYELLDDLGFSEYLELSVLLLRYLNKEPEQTEDYYSSLVEVARLFSGDFVMENKDNKYYITWNRFTYIIKNNGEVEELDIE